MKVPHRGHATERSSGAACKTTLSEHLAGPRPQPELSGVLQACFETEVNHSFFL